MDKSGWSLKLRIQTVAIVIVMIIGVLGAWKISRPRDGSVNREGQVRIAPSREWEVMKRDMESFKPKGSQLHPLGFASGGNVTALAWENYDGAPLDGGLFEYTAPKPTFAGPISSSQYLPANSPLLTDPTSVAGVTWDGFALFLDQRTSAIGAYTIGGLALLKVTTLDSGHVVQSTCAPDTRAVAFIEASRPDTVLYRALDGLPDRQVVIQRNPTDTSDVRWPTAKLSGMMGAGCVLWAPTWQHAYPITDSTVGPPWTLRWDSASVSTMDRLATWFGRRRPVPAITRDVTAFPGGIAVLPADGKVIDLYSFHDGQYLETLVLPRPALTIAGAPNRLFVLSQAQDSILYASYVLPMNARALTPEGWRQERADYPVPAWLKLVRRQRR